jgi:Bacterial Ig-like domain (group 3)
VFPPYSASVALSRGRLLSVALRKQRNLKGRDGGRRRAAGAATTISLDSSSSPNPSQVGQAATFTATVTGSGGTPTGNLVFKDGGAVLGTVALSGGAASLTAASLTLGSHSITASYLGSSSFAASTSAAPRLRRSGFARVQRPHHRDPRHDDEARIGKSAGKGRPHLTVGSSSSTRSPSRVISYLPFCCTNHPALTRYPEFTA